MSEQMKAITRHELYEKIWKSPLKQIAEELGTNYIALVQACARLDAAFDSHKGRVRTPCQTRTSLRTTL
jgi:hypothetical protein